MSQGNLHRLQGSLYIVSFAKYKETWPLQTLNFFFYFKTIYQDLPVQYFLVMTYITSKSKETFSCNILTLLEKNQKGGKRPRQNNTDA